MNRNEVPKEHIDLLRKIPADPCDLCSDKYSDYCMGKNCAQRKEMRSAVHAAEDAGIEPSLVQMAREYKSVLAAKHFYQNEIARATRQLTQEYTKERALAEELKASGCEGLIS